jgi:hypothetical protein
MSGEHDEGLKHMAEVEGAKQTHKKRKRRALGGFDTKKQRALDLAKNMKKKEQQRQQD